VTAQNRSNSADDRLICLADAIALVPFSETTLRRAIAGGELDAWRPNRDGKLVLWRSALIEWATRRPATDRQEREARRERRASSRARRRGAASTQTPDPITLPEIA
jgi:hypothetical protein